MINMSSTSNLHQNIIYRLNSSFINFNSLNLLPASVGIFTMIKLYGRHIFRFLLQLIMQSSNEIFNALPSAVRVTSALFPLNNILDQMTMMPAMAFVSVSASDSSLTFFAISICHSR